MCGQKWLFLKNFLKHPKMLGSIVPSSPFLMNRLLNRIDWNEAGSVVEFGPGVGNFTTEILKRMRPDARLTVIELNYDFVVWLRSTIRDPRLHVAHGSAAAVQSILPRVGCKHIDYAISGIPFSTIPTDVRFRIVEETHRSLGPNGQFMVYQFSRAIHPALARVFRQVDEEFEPFNILPARLFYCAK